MNYRVRASSAKVGAVMVLLLLSASARADTVSRSFDVPPGGTLDIETDVGSIDVVTGGSAVEVRVEREGRDGEQLELDFRQQGDRVLVRGEWPQGERRWGQRAKVTFHVTVPKRFDLELQTSGGSITVGDLDGTVEADTSGGSLDFGVIQGDVDAHTSGGSIELAGGGANARLDTSGGSIRVGEVAGDLAAKTSGGSIRIDGVRGRVDASTSGGSVKARLTAQPTQDCRLSTSGGTVTLYIDPSMALDIDAHSSSGGVRSDVPIEGQTRGKRRLKGSINGGGPTMRLHSSGGGVRIRTM
jgi:DUF4097 and DUF4098 domain-containing protein YvlB